VNLEKFRQIKPSINTPDVKNPDYVDSLNALGQRRSHTALFASVGTVAACILIIAAVIIWSAIGKSIRDGENIAEIPPAEEGQEIVTAVSGSETEYTVDEDAKHRFAVDIGVMHYIYQIPYFDEEHPPTAVDMANRMATVKTGMQYGKYITYIPGKKLNEYSKKWFGVEIADDNAKYGAWGDMADYMGPDLISMSSVELSDGSTQYTATYNLGMGDSATLVYVGEMYAPTRFISHTRGDKVLENEIKDRLYDCVKNTLEGEDFVEDYIIWIDEFWVREDGSFNFALGINALFNDGRPHSFYGEIPELSPDWQYYTFTRGKTAVLTDDMLVISNETKGFGSSYYSDEDICDAMTEAYKGYQKLMKGYGNNFGGMYYNARCDELIKPNADFAARNGADEVIIILSSFTTSAPAPDGMGENQDYAGFQWILVRNKGEEWRLVDAGY